MPYNFESQKRTARNLVLGINSQLTPGEILADNKFTRRIRFDGTSSQMDLIQSRRSDKDMSGKGTEFATDGQLVGFDGNGKLKGELDDWIAGYLFAFCMGAIADTDNMDGTYTHAISWDETTTQAKMANWYFEDTADVKRKFLDMAIADLTLTYPAHGSVMFESSVKNTGQYHNGALGGSGLPALPTNYYLLGSDTVFSLGPVGEEAVFTGRVMGGSTVKLETEVASHVAPGGGLYGLWMRTGLRKFSFQLIIAAKDTDDINTLFTGDTMSALSIVTTSPGAAGNSVLDVEIPKFKLKTNKLGADGNMVTWSIEGDETTCYKVAGGADAITVSVTNNVPTYLTGV